MISDRHERMILDEYAAAGLRPVYRSDGGVMTLGLARKLGVPLKPLAQPSNAYQEAVNE